MSTERYPSARATTEAPSFLNPESVGIDDVAAIRRFLDSDGTRRQGIEMSRYPLDKSSNPKDTETWVHVVLYENPDGGYSYAEVKDGQEIEAFTVGDEVALPQSGQHNDSDARWRVSSVKTTEAGVSLVTIKKPVGALNTNVHMTKIMPQSMLREYNSALDESDVENITPIEKSRDEISTRPFGRAALQGAMAS